MKTADILKKVKRDYGLIADEFDVTRKKPWPEFEMFLEYFAKTCAEKPKLLDIGCGNGRLFGFLKNAEPKLDTHFDYTGIDNSKGLLQKAKKNNSGAKFKAGDLLKIPCPAKSFDAVCCFAVLHHIPQELQLKALKEIRRVLKKDGILILTVWNLWQKKYKKYIDPKTNDSLIPWGSPPKANRYYYAFKPTEIINLLKKAGFRIIKKNIEATRNISFICN